MARRFRSDIDSSRMGYRFTPDDLREIREYCGSTVYLMLVITRKLPSPILALLLSEDRGGSIMGRINITQHR